MLQRSSRQVRFLSTGIRKVVGRCDGGASGSDGGGL